MRKIIKYCFSMLKLVQGNRISIIHGKVELVFAAVVNHDFSQHYPCPCSLEKGVRPEA